MKPTTCTGRQNVARLCIFFAGLVFLAETLFGCIVILGIGFNTVREIGLDFCLTMAFPIYLLRFISERLATVCLWLFFAIQWLDRCFLSSPPSLFNPFAWWHDSVLLLGIALFTVGILLRRRFSATPT